jgi:hypothetical protein
MYFHQYFGRTTDHAGKGKDHQKTQGSRAQTEGVV